MAYSFQELERIRREIEALGYRPAPTISQPQPITPSVAIPVVPTAPVVETPTTEVITASPDQFTFSADLSKVPIGPATVPQPVPPDVWPKSELNGPIYSSVVANNPETRPFAAMSIGGIMSDAPPTTNTTPMVGVSYSKDNIKDTKKWLQNQVFADGPKKMADTYYPWGKVEQYFKTKEVEKTAQQKQKKQVTDFYDNWKNSKAAKAIAEQERLTKARDAAANPQSSDFIGPPVPPQDKPTEQQLPNSLLTQNAITSALKGMTREEFINFRDEDYKAIHGEKASDETKQSWVKEYDSQATVLQKDLAKGKMPSEIASEMAANREIAQTQLQLAQVDVQKQKMARFQELQLQAADERSKQFQQEQQKNITNLNKWNETTEAIARANTTGKTQMVQVADRVDNPGTLRPTEQANVFLDPDGNRLEYNERTKSYYKLSPGQDTAFEVIKPESADMKKRIGYAIAGALIAMSSAKAGGSPAAGVQAVNEWIDQDMRRAKEKLESRKGVAKDKQGLIDLARREFADTESAMAATKMGYLSSMNAELDRLSTTATPAVQAKIEELKRGLISEREKASLEFFKAESQADYQRRQNALGFQGLMLEKQKLEAAGEKVGDNRLPGMTLTGEKKPTENDKKQITDTRPGVISLISKVSRLRAIVKDVGTEVFPTDVAKQAEQMAADIRIELKNQYQLGVLSKDDYNLLLSQLPSDPTGIRTKVVLNQLDEIERRTRENWIHYGRQRGYLDNEIGVSAQQDYQTPRSKGATGGWQ